MRECEDTLRLVIKAINHLWDGNVLSGAVGAAAINPNWTEPVVAVSFYDQTTGKWVHAEDHLIRKIIAIYGEVPKGTTMVITLEPCHAPMSDRASCSCSDLIARHGFVHVHCGLADHMQAAHSPFTHPYPTSFSQDPDIQRECQFLLDQIPDIQ